MPVSGNCFVAARQRTAFSVGLLRLDGLQDAGYFLGKALEGSFAEGIGKPCPFYKAAEGNRTACRDELFVTAERFVVVFLREKICAWYCHLVPSSR